MTTNGDVREGVLDAELAAAEEILNGDSEDESTLPFLCRIDSKQEVHDPNNWVKANPSLPYMPDLMQEIKDEYVKWSRNPLELPAFMSKRMNVPDMASDKAVTEYDHIKATNRPIPDLHGCQCIVGIDTSKTTDFESVSAIFKRDGFIYVINHTFICMQNRDLPRIKVKEQFPKWVEMGIVTLVDDVEISPEYIKNYIAELKSEYRIQKVCIDDFRYSLFSAELTELGFSKQQGNLKLVRLSDIAKTVPLIESAFNTDSFIWGDNACLRWCTNNTKITAWKAKTTLGADIGNQIYAKIEKRSRKTDAFMSLVHAMTASGELQESRTLNRKVFKARTY